MRYVTLQGERWDQIAYKVYGDAYRVPDLLNANYLVPKLLMEGGELVNVPSLSDEEVKTSEAVVPWLSS